jgi:TetR/AcrR family transcriptional regulator
MNPTEAKILAAAEEVFMKKGYDGARMQEIADLAEINKAMLHYYFRSKTKLFEKIFEQKFKGFFPSVEGMIEEKSSFREKAAVFVEQYIQFLIKNPYLPNFILNTINNNPDFVNKLPHQLPQKMMMSYMEDAGTGKCRMMPPGQLFMSILGICVFPFLGKPLFIKMMNLSEDDFKNLMEERIKEVKLQVDLLLKPE